MSIKYTNPGVGFLDDRYVRLNPTAAQIIAGQTLNIEVPTTTSEALILKTTDDSQTKNLLEARDSSDNVFVKIWGDILGASSIRRGLTIDTSTHSGRSIPLGVIWEDSNTSLTSNFSGVVLANNDTTTNNYAAFSFVSDTSTGVNLSFGYVGSVFTDHTNGSADADIIFGARSANVLGENFRVTGAGQVQATSRSSVVTPLVVKLAPSATANALQITDSSDNVLSGADERGVLFSDGGTPVSNTFLGGGAGNPATAGTNNVGIGSGALFQNTGSNNIGIGRLSMANIGGTGSNNVAVGSNALQNLTSGIRNVALGDAALSSLTTNQQNVAVGYHAGSSSNGQRVVAIGADALSSETGGFNTALGWRAGFAQTTGTGNLYLGYNVVGVAGESNMLHIHNSDNPTTPLILGDFTAGVTIHPQATTAVGLTIVGQPSQTANLQEWQDSSANIRGSFSITGGLSSTDGIFNVHKSDGTALGGLSSSGNDLILHATVQNINFISQQNVALRIFANNSTATAPHNFVADDATQASIGFFSDKTTGGSYRTRGTTTNIIESNDGILTFTADTGQTNLTVYTPTVIATLQNASPNVLIEAAATTHVPLTIKLAGSQTGDGWQLNDSNDLNLAKFRSTGQLSIDRGTGFDSADPGSSDNAQEAIVARIRTTGENTQARAIWAGAQADPANGVTVNRAHGLNAFGYISDVGTVTTLLGGRYSVRMTAAGTATTAIAVQAFVEITAAGTITDLAQYQSGGTINQAATIENLYGMWLKNPNNSAGTITNQYGILIEDVDDATNTWAIQTNAGNVALNIAADASTSVIIGSATRQTNADLLQIEGGWTFKESTAPTADDSYGKIWTESNNELFFQSGDGNTHLLHGDAFANLWFHGTTDTVAISTAATFTLIDSFENVGDQDDLGNVVGNTTNNDFTIGTDGGGEYGMTFHVSISSATAASEMVIALGITLNTPIDVTGATNATPIVVTSVAHGLLNGDMVTIAGATTNTGANGDFMVTAKTADTFTLVDLAGADSVGNGVYDASSGDVTIFYPGNLPIHREVGFGALGVGGANAGHSLVAGDKVKMYVANVDSTRDLLIAIVNMELIRIGD